MRNRFIWPVCFASFLIVVGLISCSSTKKRTEERAKERVTQFIRLMSENRIEEAEKLLSRELTASETKELFMDSYDHWKLKDTSLVIDMHSVAFHIKDDKNRATVAFTVRNEKSGFTRHASLPVKFEKGDWYIGG
jgi:hypothetical protein